MERNRIKAIIEKLEDIKELCTDDEFNVATYIFMKLGKFEFDNYINEDEIKEINEVLKRHSTIFSESVNDYVELILNTDEETED